jgi:hypothetical protein
MSSFQIDLEQGEDYAQMVLSQVVPEEYLYDPLNAEPSYDHLREAVSVYDQVKESSDKMDNTLGGEDEGERKDEALAALIEAAEKDVSMHLARVKAVLTQDPRILENYSQKTDPVIQQRLKRLEDVKIHRQELRKNAHSIISGLNYNMDLNSPSKKKNLTQADIMKKRLDSWKQALELYIHDTQRSNVPNLGENDSIQSKPDITLLELLQHLVITSSNDDNEESLTTALEQASSMCNKYEEKTSKLLQDAFEHTSDTFHSYQIHLMAHSIAAQSVLKQSEGVHSSFLQYGKEALKIGRALEMAEAKRRQSDHASVLLRRWWMMENLAEQEMQSGEEIRVHEEVRGIIPSNSCRMDPLFTRPENSLEAAKTLRSLRMIVKCRSSSASSSPAESKVSNSDVKSTMKSPTHGNINTMDPQASKRFDLTDRLIRRISDALEQRLLNTFTEIYSEGGTYDFSTLSAANRVGRLNWVWLREVAEALMNFDSGRSLHKRYVDLVISTKFPELFEGDEGLLDSDTGEQKKSSDDDIDGTRSKLSNLFHRVCEVCAEEFQLIAHVFSPALPPHLYDSVQGSGRKLVPVSSFHDSYAVHVARALLQRLISDPDNGMQAQINGLLESIDQQGDFDSGAKKLDTFVVIHEKAAGFFSLLQDAAKKMEGSISLNTTTNGDELSPHNTNAVSISSLNQFLTTQEIALCNIQRNGYLNLELRLLHHHCCSNLDRNGGKLSKPIRVKDTVKSAPGTLTDYRAPIMPLDKDVIIKNGFSALLNGPLKQSVLRQPLIHATDSLSRARLMFGSGSSGGAGIDSTARVISTIFTQMCNFYGPSYLYPIIDSLSFMLNMNPPNAAPTLPFDENQPPHDLGVDENFWIVIERIHSAAKSFDRELWAENRTGSMRVWEILVQTRSQTSLTLAKDRRIRFFQELEERGESAMMKALDAMSNHVYWQLIIGGENIGKIGINLRKEGPYAQPSGSIMDSTNSPAVKALTFCLRSQFVHAQAALTPQSLAGFWIALSKRLYDILVARLLQHYKVSTYGAVLLSRDVEALRSVSLLAGNDHEHWDVLRELLTLFMTPPDSLKTLLVGAEGDINSGKGMFGSRGKEQSIVFMSRRVDYRYKTAQGAKKSPWVIDLLDALGVSDPTDGRVNIGNFAAENIIDRK